MNDIIAFVPCRSGSKGILDKNIKLLGGKPLIAWSIETAFKAGISRVVVDTDSEVYSKIAREYGAEVMIRPEELAQDDTPMFQVLKSEIFKLEVVPEIVVLLQPTSPLRKTTHVKNALSFFVENRDTFDSLISVEQVPEKYNPSQVLVKTALGYRMANGLPISSRLTRRQEFPQAYIPTGEIYIFKTSNLEKGSMYGEKQMLYECEGSVNINTEADFLEAEKQLNG